jgi:hypothetical protein
MAIPNRTVHGSHAEQHAAHACTRSPQESGLFHSQSALWCHFLLYFYACLSFPFPFANNSQSQQRSFTRIHNRLTFLTMGFLLADRAWIWCISCAFLNASLYFSLPKRLGDTKLRLEFAQRLTSALHAMWMFFGAVDSWARGRFTLRDGADVFNGYTSIVEFSPSIDARIDHMLGYLLVDQVAFHHYSSNAICPSHLRNFRHSTY